MAYYEGLIIDIGDVIIRGTKGIESKLDLRHSFLQFNQVFLFHLNKLFLAHCSEEEFLYSIQVDLNLIQDINSLKQIFRSQFLEIENMLEIVSNINNVCPVYLFSDHSKSWISHLDDKYNLNKIATSRDFSFERGFLKDSFEAYNHLISRYYISYPDRWFFIDDSERNCKIAKSFGFNALVFNTQFELLKELKK